MVLPKNHMNDYNESLGLHSASAKGDVFMVKMCLKRGVPINIPDVNGNTALHQASKEGCLKVVQVLIKNQAFINVVNRKGNTPLHESCKKGNLELSKYLIDEGASVFAQNEEGKTPLHVAFSVKVVGLLIDHGALVNAVDKDGYSPLHNFCSDIQITQFLLKNKASVDARSLDGETPSKLLMECSNVNDNIRKSIMDMYIEEGADVDVKDNGGYSLLHYSIMYCSVTLTQYLLDNGANVDTYDESNRSLLNFAGQQRLWKLIYVIYKHILKLKVAAIEVKEDIDSIILTPNKILEMKETSELCSSELEKIKSTKVYKDFSFMCLLAISHKPFYLLDEELVDSLEQALQSPLFLDEYPMYGHLLNNTFKKFKRSKFYLLYLASRSILNTTRKTYWQCLPDLARDKIFDFLSVDDLKNVIKSG